MFCGFLLEIEFLNFMLAQFRAWNSCRSNLYQKFKMDMAMYNITKSIYKNQSRSVCQSIIDEDLERRDPSLPPRLVLSDEIFSLAGRQIIFQKNSHLTELFNQKYDRDLWIHDTK